ncbi:terminase gpA endonuclease subunit [Brevundimonas sp. DWR2-3-1b1]|uniref:terminase gpA endonuclease subunit n=1 Tax=unclassified Brevundimonas TaxID=2622653 RepID=UPI003CECF5FC
MSRFGLASAAAVIFGAIAAAAKPAPSRRVAEWADQDRWVAAESGSSRPGKWMNATTPYGVEMMECLDNDYPARRVIVSAGAQLIKSELFLNWAGQTICDDPAPMMLVLPSLDELRNWNSTKWQPTLDATPALKRRVFERVERSRAGSTTNFKAFRGGFLMVTTAMSSKGLQGRSVKRLACDEVSEFPLDTGGRGDPIKQAETRGDGHDDFKALYTSTPKELPGCRITKMLHAGDHRIYYVDCPHCGDAQQLVFEQLQAPTAENPRVAYGCLACGSDIDEIHKPAMLAGGRWIKTYTSEDPANPAPPLHFPADQIARWRARSSEGRDPSFHLWQAYSPFKSWSVLWGEYVEASKDDADLKVFWQQKLGRAWDPATDAPDEQKLFEARGRFVQRGVVPAWACELVLAVDNQGDRIEWDGYAMGPDLSMARFDWGVIEHDPLTAEAWASLAEVVGRRYPGEVTIPLGWDMVGVDLGGKKGTTERVYRFVRARPNVVAVKGSSNPDEVPLRKGKRRVLRLKDGSTLTIEPHLIGGHGLKLDIYSMLQTSLEAEKERLPGGLYNPADATLEDFKQYTAEVYRKPTTQRAGAVGHWDKLPGRSNERLDNAIYARGMFWSRGAYTRTEDEWRALFEARAERPESVLPLFDAVEIPMVTPAEPASNPGPTKNAWHSSRRKL